MARILINFAHPALEKSRMQRELLAMVKGMQGITFNDLYERYPDLDIDVNREQELLEKHDVILMQHPFYWYSAPAIVKQWTDLVLEHGWAYGHQGKALEGKYFTNIISTGASESAYHETGIHRFTIRQFLTPFIQTAVLCNMEYISPYVIYGVHRMDISDIKEAAQEYRRVLEGLRDDKFEPSALLQVPNMNQILQLPSPTQ
ncbi:MAG TPA: NAD(P)H-dependent oxidoreductase [Chitinophaga sp.]|uniref:NAD(P)H-dependent oxidoreductase n=1 Tax=Chitinophaga sp. TaxID=1869181 RepID=UPI002CB218A7|nr:NAD(P)H-dependent oxidoreductase [Chitinophaga sp.]HVI46736.1 NAD(P)H-dependent oxidoreductase [Chitinophaga sp.]